MSGANHPTPEKMIGCQCADTADKALAKAGVTVDWAFMIHPQSGVMRTRARVAVRKLDPKSRKSMPIVAATYCPFCGKEYPRD